MLDAEHLGESCAHGSHAAISLPAVTDASGVDQTAVLVGVIMGSDSDLPVMQGAIDVLDDFGVPFEVRVISAHRTPEVMVDYAQAARPTAACA